MSFHTELPPNIRLSFLVTNGVFLVAGTVAIGFMVYYSLHPFARRNVVITPDIMYGALAVGCATVLTSLLGFFGLLNPIRRKLPLVLYCWFTGVIQISAIILGACVWFRTLDIKSDYYPKWKSWDKALRGNFQDYSRCCGYLNADDYAAESPLCPASRGPDDEVLPGCSDQLLIYVNDYLQNMYIVMFLFVGVGFVTMLTGLVLFLSSRDLKRYIRTSEKLVQLQNAA
ncbi:hypothetical protein IWQ61_005403 [Dispira simplex]|nr:hypothetical protein IWQ61_005403 [Dispira simplex]